MSNVDSTSQYVKVLSKTGSEYVNGIVYSVYEVFNHNTGKRETRLSLSDSLDIGSTYALDYSDRISSDVRASKITGIVNGYTSSTVTVSGNIYKLASDAGIYKINSNLTLSTLTMPQVNGTVVEFVVIGGEVKSIISGSMSFAANYDASTKTVVVTPNADISHIDVSDIKTVSVVRDGNAISTEGWNFRKDGSTLSIPLYWITEGSYNITFTVSGAAYTVTLDLPSIVPAQ